MASEPFLDFAAYMAGIYSPPPALVALAARDPFWKTLGGRVDDPFGDDGETIRQRAAAAARGIAGYARDGSLISGSPSSNGAGVSLRGHAAASAVFFALMVAIAFFVIAAVLDIATCAHGLRAMAGL